MNIFFRFDVGAHFFTTPTQYNIVTFFCRFVKGFLDISLKKQGFFAKIPKKQMKNEILREREGYTPVR
jgi:hypothetical protein